MIAALMFVAWPVSGAVAADAPVSGTSAFAVAGGSSAPHGSKWVRRRGVEVGALEGEVRIAFVPFEFATGRLVFRGPLLGTTVLLDESLSGGGGRVGLAVPAELLAFLCLNEVLSSGSDRSSGAEFAGFVLVPPLVLANFQCAYVVAGPSGGAVRSAPAWSLLVENRSDVFVPARAPAFLRVEPAVGVGLDLPFGTGVASRRRSLVVQAGLAARLDWMEGGAVLRRHSSPRLGLALFLGDRNHGRQTGGAAGGVGSKDEADDR